MSRLILAENIEDKWWSFRPIKYPGEIVDMFTKITSQKKLSLFHKQLIHQLIPKSDEFYPYLNETDKRRFSVLLPWIHGLRFVYNSYVVATYNLDNDHTLLLIEFLNKVNPYLPRMSMWTCSRCQCPPCQCHTSSE